MAAVELVFLIKTSYETLDKSFSIFTTAEKTRLNYVCVMECEIM